MNRKLTGQSEPYYKLIQPIPPTWRSWTSLLPFDLFFETPTKKPKEYFQKKRRRGRRRKWERKGEEGRKGERKREKEKKGARAWEKEGIFFFLIR